MTPKQIQNRLFLDFGGSSSVMIPNFTPKSWFEADLFRVTKAGIAEEFEIKMSIADFRVDAKKGPSEHDKLVHSNTPEHWQHLRSYRDFDPRTKHARLMAGDFRGPARFSFVVAESILDAVQKELPEWAGLYYARTWHERVLVHRVKPAPKLHRSKVDPDVMEAAKRAFYFRYWNIRSGQPESEVPA